MKQTIHVSIDSNGRAKASSKNLGNQYETGVAEFEIELSSDWQDESYFYYLVVIPPESTGLKQYAVPLSRDFIYLISSNITWYLGTFKFLIIVMNKELDESGQIPTDGVVSISDEWEGEVNKSSLKLAELAEQPENPNFTLLYTDLMALRNSVEQIGNYAQTQGDYAKGVGEQLLLDKENGVFNGDDGEDGKSAGFGTPVVEVETLEADSAAKVEITASGEDVEKVFNFTFGIPRGKPGRGIVSIIRTSGTGAPGTYDTYTITYSDNTTSSFQIYNGANGEGGGTSGNVPTKLSELTNDTGFITNTANNLVNYYLKSESYNKDEINALIGGLSSLSAIVVTELPTENISTSTIYLIANTEQVENNYYDEFLYINNVWEKIGTTQTKLDNYYTKEETAELIENIDYGGKASSNPIGTIIPFMGTIPPKYYLTCDGTVLNIADYLELATHFKNQFGSINHFGGDGETTFALPDLRNEFLRGYGDLSGEIGEHQDATSQPRIFGSVGSSSGNLAYYADTAVSVNSADTTTEASTGYKVSTTAYTPSGTAVSTYTSRPTNVAVLFCIKYTVSSEEIEVEGIVTEESNKIATSGAVKTYVDGAITGALEASY